MLVNVRQVSKELFPRHWGKKKLLFGYSGLTPWARRICTCISLIVSTENKKRILIRSEFSIMSKTWGMLISSAFFFCSYSTIRANGKYCWMTQFVLTVLRFRQQWCFLKNEQQRFHDDDDDDPCCRDNSCRRSGSACASNREQWISSTLFFFYLQNPMLFEVGLSLSYFCEPSQTKHSWQQIIFWIK